MSKPLPFKGAATALVTPFKNGMVDYEAMGKMIDWQVESGIQALVVCATTGENPTLQDDEHLKTLEFAVERTAGRVPVIAGTGSNYTDHAIHFTREACAMGCDGVLVVTPYYNKATQKGLIKSFGVIADASTKPVIVYNVPSRTGVNIQPATCVELAKHPMICGIKEASGDLSQITEIASLCGDDLWIYSGNDDQIVPILAVGGQGVISVLSNVMPAETQLMCEKFFAGDIAGSRALQLKYFSLIKALFSQVNPIPVKAALARMGKLEDELRLPLIPMEDAPREKLYAIMDSLGIH